MSEAANSNLDIANEIPQENVNPQPQQKKKGKVKILTHIQVKTNGSRTDKPIVKKTFNDRSNSTTDYRRVESLEAVIDEVEREREMELCVADMTIPNCIREDLRTKIKSKQKEILNNKHIQPSKGEFLKFLNSHSTRELGNWRNRAETKCIKHDGFSMIVDDIEMKLPRFHCAHTTSPSYLDTDPIYHISLLCRMPNFRSVRIKYSGAYTSNIFDFEESDVVLTFEIGAPTVTLMMQTINAPEKSQMYIRSGMNWKFEFSETGGTIKVDFINLGVAYMKKHLEISQDKYYYVRKNQSQ